MSLQGKRIISLVDMDCFYVQVVQRKNPSLKGKPCAVVQYNAWQGGGIIAVGYEARKFGVTRQMRGKQAQEKCPEIILVPVPESRGKADLTQFREAGAEVIEILADFTDCLERASIDEAYMDLTNTINKTIDNYTVEEVALETFKTTHIVGLDNIEVNLTKNGDIMKCDLYRQWKNTLESNTDTYHLAIGSIIANNMRKAVLEKTGFSCSAGVGTNKMLAKVVAGFHKPNQQTLIIPENVAEMFQTTKVRKIRSLGGKVGGQLVDKLKVEYMSELLNISLQELQTQVGAKNGELVYWLCRGIDHEPVRARQLPKSVGCSKNFKGFQKLSTKADVHKWLTNLTEEIIERLDKEKEQNQRIATLFTVGCLNELNQSQSRRCNVGKTTLNDLRDEAFRALLEFNNAKTGTNWTPAITNLHLNASKFQTISTHGSNSINSYMSTKNSESSTHSLNDLQRSSKLLDVKSARKSKEGDNLRIEKEVSVRLPSSVKSRSPRKREISNFFAVAQRNVTNLPSTSKALVENEKPIFTEYYGPSKDKNTVGKLQEMKSSLTKISLNRNDNEEMNDLLESNVTESYSLPESPIGIKNNGSKTTKSSSGSHLFSRFCRTVSETSKESTEKSVTTSLSENTITEDHFNAKNLNSSSIVSRSCNKIEDINRRISSGNGAENVCENSNVNAITSNHSLTINDLMICERCGKRVLAWDLPDHMDFHFAKDLQDSLKTDFLNLYNPKNNTSKQSSTSKMFKGGPPKKKTRLENSVIKYFSPVKKT